MTTTIGLLLLAAVALLGAFVVFDRKDARAATERAADREERAVLLQRIQAPQAAVHEHHTAAVPPVPDAGALPMSDVEIAQLEDAAAQDGASELARLIARMEAAENGTRQVEDGLIP